MLRLAIASTFGEKTLVFQDASGIVVAVLRVSV